MPKHTHCNADLLHGTNWEEAEKNAKTCISGTPSGVVTSIMDEIIFYDLEEAIKTLEILKDRVDYAIKNPSTTCQK